MLKSLQTQIVLLQVILVSTISVQLVLALTNFQKLEANNLLLDDAVTKVKLVHELERDLLDLQRNLLIYKETASESVVDRFNSIVQNIVEKEDQLRLISSKSDVASSKIDLIDRMKNHIEDYRINFDQVIENRRRRDLIFKDDILVNIEKLKSLTDELPSNKVTTVENQLNIIHVTTLEYHVNPAFDKIEIFRKSIKNIKDELDKNGTTSASFKTLLTKLNTDFVKFTQATRGYVFLVNVVMAGSANEFLYLTKELSDLVAQEQNEISQNTDILGKKVRANALIIGALCLIISLFIVVFFIFRVMRPIIEIANVFRLLTDKKQVSQIPGKDRSDEIGDLSKAGDVFRERNKQTEQLLQESQSMFERQQILNEELKTANKKAKQAAESKSMFLANMSHEIRTPMNGITGLIELTLRTKLDEKQKDYLEKANSSCQIMMGVINDILDFSKIEAGKLDIENIVFDMHSLIDGIIASTLYKAKEKNLYFHVNVSHDTPASLKGDPLRISQVLLNLCNNAIKFTSVGGITLAIRYLEDDHKLEFSVSDSGIGMSDDMTERMFDSFTQEDGTTSRKFGGTGLGLAIVKQLVTLMDGSVEVASKKGKGSTFKVTFTTPKVSDQSIYFPVAIENKSLIYHQATDIPVISREIFTTLNTTPTFTQTLDKAHLDTADVLMVEIANHDDLDELHNLIEQYQLQQSTSIGLFVISNSRKLYDTVSKKYRFPILSSTYSPRDLYLFLESLCHSPDNVRITHDPKQVAKEELEEKTFNGHVLLVEDNTVNQVVAGDILEDFGLTYDIAEDGQQALDKYINSPDYDIIFMDIQMPVMDGYTATRILREKGFTEIKICGLSANAMKEDFTRAREAGMDDYLTKPLSWKAMQHVLEKYLPEETPQ